MSYRQGALYEEMQSQMPNYMVAQPTTSQNLRGIEFFYAYVAESEYSSVGYWIPLEADKTLSIQSLRAYFGACFGIKYNILNASKKVETQYVRYQNGFFQFPAGLDMNNTRFIAYYYNNVDDLHRFTEMNEANDVGKIPPSDGHAQPSNRNEATLFGQTTVNFETNSLVHRGATSTPKPAASTSLENISSSSDVMLNEPPVEVITVQDTQVSIQPPPPPYAPQSPMPNAAGAIRGTPSLFGPNIPAAFVKQEPCYVDSSGGFEREHSSVMVNVQSVPKNKNMLGQYQSTRPKPQNVAAKTPLKVTVKQRTGRRSKRATKILRIEDGTGRTTALLTKRNLVVKKQAQAPKPYGKQLNTGVTKSRKRSKRRRHDAQQTNYHLMDATQFDLHPVLSVLLVGFHSNEPAVRETTSYFSDFGVVTNLQLYTFQNRKHVSEYYAFMMIRVRNLVSLFSDRHLYNGTVIYAVRVDETTFPSRVRCRVCGHQGVNIGYLHYHLEGHHHQKHLLARLEGAASPAVDVYRDSYYRITCDELYVQFPSNPVQEMIRNDYWKRSNNHPAYERPPVACNRFYTDDLECYY